MAYACRNQTLNDTIGIKHAPTLLVTFDFQIVHLAANQTLSVQGNIFRMGAEGGTKEMDE